MMRSLFYLFSIYSLLATYASHAVASPESLGDPSENPAHQCSDGDSEVESLRSSIPNIGPGQEGTPPACDNEGGVAVDLPHNQTFQCSKISVDQVINAALQQEGLGRDQIRSWYKKASWAAFLPQVSVLLSRVDSQGEFSGTYQDSPDKVTWKNYLALRWEVRATWDLSRLFFDTRELSVADRARQLAIQRQRFIEYVVHLYFERCRLILMSRIGIDKKGMGKMSRPWRIRQLTALLNAYTNGLLEKEHILP